MSKTEKDFELLQQKTMRNASKAFDIQEKIANLIDKLDKLGFEYMYYNMQSSIRRKRSKKNV